MRKRERHAKIEEILRNHIVAKQEQLVEFLEDDYGILVTQATISRDIKELKLVKTPYEKNKYRYATPGKNPIDAAQRLKRMLHDAFVSVDTLQHFTVLKTAPGAAQALGMLFEQVYADYLFTVMTDDDKVLFIAKTAADAEQLAEKIRAER